jgi:hypothetical protein
VYTLNAFLGEENEYKPWMPKSKEKEDQKKKYYIKATEIEKLDGKNAFEKNSTLYIKPASTLEQIKPRKQRRKKGRGYLDDNEYNFSIDL